MLKLSRLLVPIVVVCTLAAGALAVPIFRWHNQDHHCVALQVKQQAFAKQVYLSRTPITLDERVKLKRMRRCAWSAKAASNMLYQQHAYARVRAAHLATHVLRDTSHVATLVPTSCVTVTCLQQTAYSMALAQFGSTAEANCVMDIVTNHENSSWQPVVPGQSIYTAWGIPQADPGTKMKEAGSDWETNGVTQERWMIQIYIPERWGTPCNADNNEVLYHSY